MTKQTLTETLEPRTYITPEDDGFVSDVDFATYLLWLAVSNSRLSSFAKSAMHYRRYQEQTYEASPAQIFGTLIHAVGLGDDVSRFVVEPDFGDIRKADGTVPTNRKATAEYKRRQADFRASARPDAIFVTQEQMDAAKEIRRQLLDHPLTRPILLSDQPRLIEESAIVTHKPTGLRLKSRFDLYAPTCHLICDLKSTSNLFSFSREIQKWGYHRAASFYTGVAEMLTGAPHKFALVAVESSAPYAIKAALVADEAIEQGRKEVSRMLRQLAECEATNVWPGPESPEYFDLPRWYYEQEDK